jgi:hypothetical protein
LSAGGNYFTGKLPEEQFILSNLRELWIATNDFSGPLPETIEEAKSLEVIYLWVEENGKFSGTIPSSLYNMKQLKQLSLSGHAFSGIIQSEIGNLNKLTELKINDNEFTGTLPSEMGLCEQLGKTKLSCSVTVPYLFIVHSQRVSLMRVILT